MSTFEEDNLVNQKVAQRMLERFGCRVDVAANGEEALELAKPIIAEQLIRVLDRFAPMPDSEKDDG